jgi:hypothetical protein
MLGRPQMVTKNFPKEVKKFEIETYERPKNLKGLRKTHAPFTGSPLKHPNDPEKIILVPNPYSSSPFYYEFKSDDVTYAEQLPSIVNLEGETVTMVRFWVKKMSVGILCTPFLVEENKT